MFEQLLLFFYRHWVLSLALVLTLLLILIEEWHSRIAGLRPISLQDCILLLSHKQGIILDLRDSNEFKQSHISGAINISQKDFTSKIKKLSPNREKTIILVGSNGSSIPLAITKQLKEFGYTQLGFLKGGLASWKQAQLPLTSTN